MGTRLPAHTRHILPQNPPARPGKARILRRRIRQTLLTRRLVNASGACDMPSPSMLAKKMGRQQVPARRREPLGVEGQCTIANVDV